ncbi:hypothetical protein [Nocardioides oleivorans]|uniref:hypothetical protein n=1 Tax=Nocardioides oleivorans TaxID=273676 RepID=UPI0013EBF58B|nr:hypothetical protein [Nocardioides oleivorans]
MKRYTNADPTATAAVKAADRAKGIPTDRALILAAEAKAKGDMAGYELFMAAARRGGGE